MWGQGKCPTTSPDADGSTGTSTFGNTRRIVGPYVPWTQRGSSYGIFSMLTPSHRGSLLLLAVGTGSHADTPEKNIGDELASISIVLSLKSVEIFGIQISFGSIDSTPTALEPLSILTENSTPLTPMNLCSWVR